MWRGCLGKVGARREYSRGCLGGVGSELNVAGVFGQGGGQT